MTTVTVKADWMAACGYRKGYETTAARTFKVLRTWKAGYRTFYACDTHLVAGGIFIDWDIESVCYPMPALRDEIDILPDRVILMRKSGPTWTYRYLALARGARF